MLQWQRPSSPLATDAPHTLKWVGKGMWRLVNFNKKYFFKYSFFNSLYWAWSINILFNTKIDWTIFCNFTKSSLINVCLCKISMNKLLFLHPYYGITMKGTVLKFVQIQLDGIKYIYFHTCIIIFFLAIIYKGIQHCYCIWKLVIIALCFALVFVLLPSLEFSIMLSCWGRLICAMQKMKTIICMSISRYFIIRHKQCSLWSIRNEIVLHGNSNI